MEPKFEMYDQIKHDGEGFLKDLLEPDMTYLYMGAWMEGTRSNNPERGVSIIDRNNNEIRLDWEYLNHFKKVGE